MIKRRDAIERITLMLGGAGLSTQLTSALMGQSKNPGSSVEVTDSMKALLADVGEVIIPTTDTPGAKAAGVQDFIVRLLRDCYVLADQEKFYAGLAKVDAASQKAHSKNFVDLSEEQKVGIIQDATKTNQAFFRQMKQLTVTGYCISEVGATQVLEYLPIPGGFKGDVPLRPDQKAWAISR